MTYEELLTKVLKEGYVHSDSTREPTIALFGESVEYDLQQGFPAITTKKLYYESVVDELLWFLSGSTNISKLKTKIWVADVANFRRRLHGGHLIGKTDSEIVNQFPGAGKIYGHQWRRFGDDGFDSGGVDQVAEVIEQLLNNPSSRRIIINAWNPNEISPYESALPPCHVMYQFNVRDGYLDCLMTQRSADLGLGLPFNIASTATLMFIFSLIADLKPGKLKISIGNAHIYESHVEACNVIASKSPYPFPTLDISESAKAYFVSLRTMTKSKMSSSLNDIQDFVKPEDFTLINYQHHSAVKMTMLSQK